MVARHSAWHAFTVFPWARARDAAIQNPAEHTTATIPIFMFWLLNSATVCSGKMRAAGAGAPLGVLPDDGAGFAF